MKEEKFALGYLRVNNMHDDQQINIKLKQMREYCEIHQLNLPLIMVENKAVSRNFTGDAWKDIERTLDHAEGRIQTIVISERDNLTRNMGLFLLKEKELREKYGVTVDIAGGKNLKMDHSQGFSMN